MSNLCDVVNDSEQLVKLTQYVNEAHQIYSSIEKSKSEMKDIANVAKEVLGVKTADFNKLVKFSFNESLDEEIDKLAEIEIAVKKISSVPNESDI